MLRPQAQSKSFRWMRASVKAHLLLISWSVGCVVPPLALRPATQSPHPPSLALSSEPQSSVNRVNGARLSRTPALYSRLCARCRRLRCLRTSCETRAVVSAEQRLRWLAAHLLLISSSAGCVLPLLALATVLSGRRLSRVEISTPLLLALEVVVALAGSAVRCVCGVPYGVA